MGVEAKKSIVWVSSNDKRAVPTHPNIYRYNVTRRSSGEGVEGGSIAVPLDKRASLA